MFKMLSIKIPLISLVAMLAICVTALSCSQETKRVIEAKKSFNQGVKAVKADNLDLAGFYFKRAVILEPSFIDAKLNLANVYFLNGNLDGAREEYNQLVSDKVDDPRIYFNLGWIYTAQGEYDTARKWFETLKKKNPSFYDADFGLGLVASQDGEDAVAKFLLEKYIENEPNGRWSEKALSILGEIDVQATGQNFVEEIENVEPAEIDEPEIDKVPKVEIKKPQEKKEDGKTIPLNEADKKENPSDLVQEGYILLEKRKFDEADKKFGRALEIEKDNAAALFGLAKTSFLSGKKTRTQDYVAKMVTNNGGDPKNSFELAEIYMKIGDKVSAIEEYRNYLSKNPFGKNSDIAKKRLTELDNAKTN